MKLFRRYIALLLVLVLAAASPVTAFAAKPQSINLNVTYVNPVYANTVSEEDLLAPQPSSATVYSTPVYVDTVEEAGQILRAQMKQREPSAVVYLHTDVADNAYLTNLCHEISDAALEHTGDPTEGDYLKWQFGGWKASISGSGSEGGYDLAITYTITHYTTAEQEETMDHAVNSLLTELDLDDASQYHKVSGIYDYICDHVTYDYDHPEEDYTLKHTAYAALIDGSAVCQGYAALLYRLALELGIDCRLIAGQSEGVNHGWNIVKLGAFYYNADSTWDAVEPDYRYFLKGSSNFSDHARFEEYTTAEFNAAYPMDSEDFSTNRCPHDDVRIIITNKNSATCTTPESHDKITICGICGLETRETVITNDPLPHNYENGICTVCGGDCPHENTTVTIENEIEATCTVPGSYDEVTTCEICGLEISVNTVTTGLADHNYVNGVCTMCGGDCPHENTTVTIENEVHATCTTQGSYDEITTCEICGLEISVNTIEIELIDHIYENGVCTMCGIHNDCLHESTTVTIENKIESSCTVSGSYDEVTTCDACGERLNVNSVTTGRLDHIYENGACTVCGGNDCPHENQTMTVENEVKATCTAPGSYDEITTCSDCGLKIYVITVEIKPTDHTYEKYTCTVCGDCTIDRISGAGRVETAIEVADQLKTVLGVEKFESVILANGDAFADALAGSYLATVKNAPILLRRSSGVGDDLNETYIHDNLAAGGTVYLLGGDLAIPETVAESISALGYNVVRLAGANRFDTNLAILKEAGVSSGEEILITTGWEFADCLSASASGKPILMLNTIKDVLTDEQIAFLEQHTDNSYTIIGGTAAVSENLETAIEAIVGDTDRLSGGTREETSVLVAEKYFEEPECVLIAYSRNFPDGLCGGPLAYKLGVPLLLVNAGKEADAAAYIAEGKIAAGYVLGGEAALSDETVKTVFDLPENAVIDQK